MNNKEHLLLCLMEEAAEITQAASKCLRFGVDDKYLCCTNLENLIYEFNDMLAVIEELRQEGVVVDIRPVLIEDKHRRLEKYRQISKERGHHD